MIVVTRPVCRAEALMTLLKHKGLPVISIPLIRFIAKPLTTDMKVQLATCSKRENDSVFFKHIFSSVSAVHFSLPYLRHYFPQLHRHQYRHENSKHHLYAIGLSTEQALEHLGYGAVCTASPPYNSESLLLLSTLQAGVDLAYKGYCLLWSIVNGRNLLSKTLKQRGFDVLNLPIYQQSSVALGDQQKETIKSYRQQGKPLVITATSRSMIRQLKHTKLYNDGDHVVCFSGRIADYAREQGIQNLYTVKQSQTECLADKLNEVYQSLR